MPLATIRARTVSGWLRLVASRYNVPVVALIRQLRTTQALADEIAVILNEHAQRDAQRLIAEKRPMPDGDTLLDSLTRGYYARIKAVQNAQRKVEQQAEWDRLYAAQQQRR